MESVFGRVNVIFFFFLLRLGRGLQCYRYNAADGFNEMTCSDERTSCILLWDVSNGHIEIVHAACGSHSSCEMVNSTLCRSISSPTLYHTCCCDSNLCNFLPGFDPRVTGALAPVFPRITPSPGMTTCAVHPAGSTPQSQHCASSCQATYRFNGDHFDLYELGCYGGSDASLCSQQCVIDTGLTTPTISCCCSENDCNLPENINYTDASRITHVVEDARCRERQCDQVCLKFLDSEEPECHCRQGYRLGSDGRACLDVNECEEETRCTGNLICVNREGSFACECPPGQGISDSGTCTDYEFGCSMNLRDCPFDDFACERVITPCNRTFSHTRACAILFTPSMEILFSYCIVADDRCGVDSCELHVSRRYFLCCCTTSRCTENLNVSALQIHIPQATPTALPTRITTAGENTSSDGFTKAGTVSSRRALHVGGTIAGVVVSVLVILFLVALVAMVILKCRTKSRREEECHHFQMTHQDEGILSVPLDFKIRPDTKTFIGRGRFGVVYSLETTDEEYPLVAQKHYHNPDACAFEAEMLRDLHHDNVVKYLYHNVHESYLLMEYAEGGSLLSLLMGSRELSLGEALSLSKTFLAGLEYLHSRSIVHRDIKSSNILVKGHTCKVADFGLVLEVKSNSITQHQVVGTPRYMAPEIIETSIESYEMSHYQMVDVYSAGLVLWEIMTRTEPPINQQNSQVRQYYPPFNQAFHERYNQDLYTFNPQSEDMKDLFKKTPQCRPVFPTYFMVETATVHDELKGFIENMWSKDANYRGTISYTKEKLVKLMGEANETTETTLRNETTL